MQTEEKKPENRGNDYARKIARIFLKVILFLILFIVVLFLLILTPPVQRFATTKVENFLQKKLKTEVEIGSISFGLTGDVSLNNIYIEDQTKDTLVSGGSLKANVNLGKLFSNEVEIKDVALENITAKIKRVLPDTAFNFQFVVDAFVTENTKNPDTAQTAPLKLNIYNVDLTNIRLVYNDVVTGNDMVARIGALTANIDTLDLAASHYSMPLLMARNVTARINQTMPLVTPEPAAKDQAEATQPATMKLNLGEIDLNKIDLQYSNDVSAFYTNLNIGRLFTQGRKLDLQNQQLYLSELQLNNTIAAIRLGNTQQAKAVENEAEKEVAVQQQQNWGVRIDKIELNNNHIRFDNDTKPKTAYGIDYSHFDGNNLTLHVNDFVMNGDSIAAVVTKGSLKEKSGFQLDALEGNLLYANTQSYIKDLYFKTPGSELKRDVILTYSSYKALTDSIQNTQIEIDIPDSYLQVKDILAFAPQLRAQPAFSDPADVWRLNLQANGNMNRLHIAALQFDGFNDTRIDASGTLASVTNPNQAGGTLSIRRFHTSKADIALLSGQNLSAMPVNLPNTVDVQGTISGGMKNLNTNLNIITSSGSLALNGQFSNLTSPSAAQYSATLETTDLQVGHIMRNPQMGSLNAAITANGKGFTPEAINANMKGTIHSFGFNNYVYRNIALDGSLRGKAFTAHVDSRDPNIHLNLNAAGNLATNASFKINGFIDSLKTLPLHFTTQQVVFRGQIDADIPSANPDNLEANVLITNALLVSGVNRLPLDTLQLVSGRTDTGQLIRLSSDIINAQLSGQYKLTDLGTIIQNNIQPYFSTSPGSVAAINLAPYDVRFTADLVYNPILTSFVPGLNNAENLHAEGRLATNAGMQASVTSPLIVFGTNEIQNLHISVNTAENGLQINGVVERLKSGGSFDLYNTRLTATALNNNVDFNLRVGDKNDRNKYFLSGLLTQPSTGDMRLSLRPDSLLLNYDRWTIAANNSISFIDNNIFADQFILQKGDQQLSLQSAGSTGVQPLNVGFANFRLATITGFIKSDSLLVDGTMNGTISLRNLMQQPVFTSDLTINNLSFRQDTIGTLKLGVASSGNRYETNLSLTGSGNDLALTGYFAPQGSNDIALDLDLAIRQLQLKSIEGAMATFVTQASGAITGNVAINGTTSQPRIQGLLDFDTASISTTMLGGPLTINDEKLSVTENGFVFDQFSIRDSANNALTINGNVQTSNFINYAFNLDVDSKDFKAINTTKKDNKLFYGQLVISTNLHVGGTEEAPVVDGALTVNNGTNFSIVLPQAEPGVVEREGVVQFVDFDAPGNDSLFMAAYDSLNVSDILGFDISTNITIQKEASFNVIVDVANGDFLNIRGAGLLSAGIDPSGKISLTGSYEIEQGAYQLSFNFLQRRFDIQKGSKIVWTGDPTSAEVDVTAVYVANTAPIDLVENQITNPEERNYFLQRLPFQVLLKLTGELMKPLIGFDVVLPTDRNYNVGGDVVSVVNSKLTQLRQEPSELNKQVFAILLLNRFVGENPFESSSGGFNAGSFARQSASKLLTEQLNNLAGGLINGVDLNFDVASSNDYSTGERRSRTDLNVGLSKRLLNDRLTVTVGSNFQLEGPQQSNQSSNNIAGNVSVNYQLSKDGRYLVRFYRRNEYEGTVDGYIIETGLGFIMSVDYNRFSQLFHARRQRNQQQRQDSTINQQQK